MKPASINVDGALAPAEANVDPVLSAHATDRHRFIEQSAIAIGQTWAVGWRRDLHREGRPAAGGWPGTLREARMRVEQTLQLEMRGRKMAAITGVERELAARTMYASARNEWRRHVDPETP